MISVESRNQVQKLRVVEDLWGSIFEFESPPGQLTSDRA